MTLDEAINSALIDIDARCVDLEVPLSNRVLIASIEFVREYVVSIDGDTKDDFQEKKWFSYIFRFVRRWYDDTYGKSMELSSRSHSRGVVVVRGVAVAANIPLVIKKVEVPGETITLTFPVVVHDEEDVEEWLLSPPSLDRLEAKKPHKVSRHLKIIAENIRSIRIYTQGLSAYDDTLAGLTHSILPEFESSANNIISYDPSARGLASWSLQMGLEKSLKILSCQKNGSYKHTHDLFSLFDDISDHIKSSNRELLKKVSRVPEVMNDRYGLGQ